MTAAHYKRAIKPGSSDKSFKIAKFGRVASCAAVCAPVGTAMAGAFAFAAISKSWVVSPTIKVCEGSRIGERLLLNELELVEPALYLHTAENAVAHMVQAVKRVIAG